MPPADAKPFFDFTLTLGNVLTIASMVIVAYTAWTAFKTWTQIQITALTLTLKTHADALTAHTERLDKHEDVHMELIKQVQDVVAKLSILMQERGFMMEERRKSPRG